MKKQVIWTRSRFIKSKVRAQASIEFSLALVTSVLFLVLTCNLFVWCSRSIVQRQVAYERSRHEAAHADDEPGKLNFYTPTNMSVFKLGGM